MKKITAFVIIVFMFSCKSENKESEAKIEEPIKVKTKEIVLSEVSIPNVSSWFKNGITITDAFETYEGQPVFLISRNDPTKSSYSGINNLKIQFGSTYKISAVVKKADAGKDFALRIQGVYPNRVDAIFDLDLGIAKEPMISGDDELAENAKATIENLGDGWYKCSLYADVYAEYMRIVLGPTNGNLKTSLWETRTGIKNSLYFVPSMLHGTEM